MCLGDTCWGQIRAAMPLIMAPSALEGLLPRPCSPGSGLFHFISGTSESPEHPVCSPCWLLRGTQGRGQSLGQRSEPRSDWVAGSESRCCAASRADPRTPHSVWPQTCVCPRSYRGCRRPDEAVRWVGSGGACGESPNVLARYLGRHAHTCPPSTSMSEPYCVQCTA